MQFSLRDFRPVLQRPFLTSSTPFNRKHSIYARLKLRRLLYNYASIIPRYSEFSSPVLYHASEGTVINGGFKLRTFIEEAYSKRKWNIIVRVRRGFRLFSADSLRLRGGVYIVD